MKNNPQASPWNIPARIGVDYLALLVFLPVFGILHIVYKSPIKVFDGSVIWPSIVLTVIVGWRVLDRMYKVKTGRISVDRRTIFHEALVIIRDWLPLILLILVYENLRSLTGLIRPDSIDDWLYKADVALFGVEPTIWIQKFANPWLTDYFAFSYMLYFILPLILGTTLYLRGRREDFQEMMLGVLLVMYTGFLLYVSFPAGPPRFALRGMYDPPQLTGIFHLFESTQGVYDKLDAVIAHSSFPSLHCALAFTALAYAWRFRSSLGGTTMFWCFLPFVVSLWTSTVYLRHHWIVDCLAGIALGAVMVAVTPWLRSRYERYRESVKTKGDA